MCAQPGVLVARTGASLLLPVELVSAATATAAAAACIAVLVSEGFVRGSGEGGSEDSDQAVHDPECGQTEVDDADAEEEAVVLGELVYEVEGVAVVEGQAHQSVGALGARVAVVQLAQGLHEGGVAQNDRRVEE